MDLQAFLALFPHAAVHTHPADDSDLLSITVDAQTFLWLPRGELTPRELALITSLTPASAVVAADPWTNFLTGHSAKQPSFSSEQAQLIYFQVRFIDPRQPHAAWLEALAALFAEVFQARFSAPNEGYLLLGQPLDPSIGKDLSGLLALLDNDFSTNTRLFIGGLHHSLAQLPLFYQFEHQLAFQAQHGALTTLSESILPYFVHAHQSELQPLAAELLSRPEDVQMIQALYQTQGNVAQAAERLFVHRNTLLYRMEKFEQHSGYNLKTMPDLVWCYLQTFV